MGVISTQNITYRLIADGQQLDVFQDEDLKISNNVTGLFDIGTLPSDFTRQITLPGTKVNNAFFEHVYDISIENPFLFATNVKVPCYLDFNGVYLINGYLQLNKVNMFQSKAVDSYEVTIFGTLSSFAKIVNNTFLTSLTNLTQYNHTSSFNNISASWNGNLFSGAVVYPLADYGNAWAFTSNNSALGINTIDGAMSVMDFKPAIKAKIVWDSIFDYAGYTYSSSFLNQAWFDDVYLFLNNSLKYPEYSNIDLETYGQIKIGPISGSNMTNLVIPDATVTTLPWYNIQSDPQNFISLSGSYKVNQATKLQGVLNLNVNISSSINNLPTTWELVMWETGSTPAGGYTTQLTNFNTFFTQTQLSRTGSIDFTYDISTQFVTSTQLSAGYYYFGIRQTKYNGSLASPTVTLDKGDNTKSYLSITKVRQAADDRVMDIALNMPYGTSGIKLIDFIIGLQRKFHLVIYPDKTKPNHFIVETFNNWYNKGRVVSFDNWIDLNQKWDVTPANNLAVNKLTFGDSLDNDYISQQFAKGAGREYAKSYYIDTTNFYSQGTLDVKTTFASSPLYYVPGTGLSGSVAGYNPVQSYQYQIGGTGYNFNSTSTACSSVYFYPTTLYAASSNPLNVTRFFTDPELTTGFNGGGYAYKYYRPSAGATYYAGYISSDGTLSFRQQC